MTQSELAYEILPENSSDYDLSFIIHGIYYKFKDIGDGDWGLGIGDWGLGPIPNPQSPIPNPQSPSIIFLYF